VVDVVIDKYSTVLQCQCECAVGREVRSPVDIIYGVERDEHVDGYESFVDVRHRMTTAYAE